LKIHLHVGVHKTATTFIQARLRGNLVELNNAGIGYMPIWAFRTSMWKNLMKMEPDKFKLEDHLEDFFPRGVPSEVKGLIISDENLLGLCGTMLSTGNLYGGVRPRMAHLRKLLAGHDVTLFCALRRYHEFLASAYCEGLRTNKRYITFEDFTSRVNWKGMSWLNLLDRVESGLRPKKMCYWRYEQFRAHAPEVMQALAFGQALARPGTSDKKNTYPSFSQTAVDALDSVSERLGREVAAKLVRPVTDALPKADGYADFDPWGAAEKQRLGRRYDDDCRRIPARKWLLAPDIAEAEPARSDAA